jgi:ABC-type hemin transport system ATPase subunit
VLMNRGRIVADGPTQQMLMEWRLSELFGRPVELSVRDGYYNLW